MKILTRLDQNWDKFVKNSWPFVPICTTSPHCYTMLESQRFREQTYIVKQANGMVKHIFLFLWCRGKVMQEVAKTIVAKHAVFKPTWKVSSPETSKLNNKSHVLLKIRLAKHGQARPSRARLHNKTSQSYQAATRGQLCDMSLYIPTEI